MGCSSAGAPSGVYGRAPFSIPKADRWAAAYHRAQARGPTRKGFQYPQSGSMGCSLAGVDIPAGERPAFSIPKADRWAAAGGAFGPLFGAMGIFQYPQSGSMGCSRQEPHHAGRPVRHPFSIPKADRWAAAVAALAQRPAAGQRFQYPQSGSMGCSAGRTVRDRVAGEVFQYPQSGSMGCSLVLRQSCYSTSLRPFSIPKADRWAAAKLSNPVSAVSVFAFQYPQSGSMGCSQ